MRNGIFSSKGKIVSLISGALALLTAVVYLICYVGTKEFNLFAFLFVLVLAAVAAAELFFGERSPWLAQIAPYVQFVCSLVALSFFIYSIYYYISVVLVGIDLDSFSAQFILSTLFFVLNAVMGGVNLFFSREEVRA